MSENKLPAFARPELGVRPKDLRRATVILGEFAKNTDNAEVLKAVLAECVTDDDVRSLVFAQAALTVALLDGEKDRLLQLCHRMTMKFAGLENRS